MTTTLPLSPLVEDPRRRDFIHVATASFAAVGAGAVVLPLVNQMNPSADVLAVSTIDVDLAGIEPGQSIVATWRGKPVFVRNLTDAEQAAANAFPTDTLRDPETLAQRTKPGHANWLVTIGICTHLGCVPLGGRAGETKGAAGGYFCPCHGSTYDTAGRIRSGPAPRNLDLPPYSFTTPTQLKIG
jgi:ubiquinol-cytochrome c reductase iron-sulfur subunit